MTSTLNFSEPPQVENVSPTQVRCLYGWTLDVSLPHFSTADGGTKALRALNGEINNRWSAWSRRLHKESVDLASLRESVQKNLEEDRKTMNIAGQEIIPLEDALFEELATAVFRVTYDVVFPANSLVSVVFHVCQDYPQSWPYSWNEYFTFDLRSGKVVDLGDLFQDLDAAILWLSQHCHNSLKPSMELEDEDILKARLELSVQTTGDLKAPTSLTEILYRHWQEVGEEEKATLADNERVLASWRVVRATNFLNGVSAYPTNFANFYLTEDAIVFGFDRRKLDAPVMSGLQEVRVPLSEVSHLLKSNF